MQVPVRIYDRTDVVHDPVELLWLFRVHMVPRPLHVVYVHVGMRASLAYPVPRAVVHPGSDPVDERDGHGRAEIGDDAWQHWPEGPTILELHAEESILSPTTRKQWISYNSSYYRVSK